MVNHRGTVVAFAMDQNRKIYYTVLDIAKEDQQKGPLDVKYWMDNPRQLSFPNEIEQVGFGVITPSQLPVVKTGTQLEVDATTVSQDEIDPFLSTTARLTADAPFQVFSDNQHIYVFRQSLAGNHADMVHKLKSGGYSGTETDQTKYVKDSANQNVPMVHETLLVDRYILAGTDLKSPAEVRFRRSENKTTPASAKDGLGAKDMEGSPFFEPTKELDFIRNLSGGCFSVILLPTQVADIVRWQIFAYNKSTKLIDSFNIERDEDGFFNTQGTRLYTSPDEQYKASVLERRPGTCPFTKLPLVPIVSKSGYAEWALQFGSSGAQVSMGNPTALQITGDQTIEMWLKPAVLSHRHNPFNKSWGGEGTINLETNGKLAYYYGTNGSDAGTDNQGFSSDGSIAAGSWAHIAIVRDLTNSQGKKLHWYINGVASGSTTANYAAATAGTQPVLIGKGYAGNFEGLIDEVRVWNRARSGSEIKETLSHRLVGDELGLAGYWRFDEGAGTKVKDQTSNGNHGTLSGAAVKWVASDAPIGDHPGMRRTSFAFGDREIDTGLAARLYYEQEKQSSAAGAKPVKQNARVLLSAVTSGFDPIVPVNKGLVLNLSGESYRSGDQWDDLSGNGNHASKSGGNMAVLHQVIDYNGKNYPVMRFSSGDKMTIADSLDLLKPFTVIIVDRYTGGANGRTLTSRDTNWLLGKYNGNNGCFMSAWVGSQEAVQANVFTISTATLTGSSPNYYLDGINKGSSGGTTAPGKLGICTYTNEVSDADIACVLIWDRVLTDNERKTVEQWLGAKYGINVSHNINLDAIARKYVAAVDAGVTREGKLAQTPDTIPLPALLPSDPGGAGSAGILGEIASLETDVPRLETESAKLDHAIRRLNDDIFRFESQVASIPTVEVDIAQLNSNLTEYQRPRYVTFYEHSRFRGDSFRMATHETNSNVGTSWNDKISSLQWDGGLKIEAYEDDQYRGRKWTFPSEQGSSFNDKITSIKVLEADWLKNSRTNTQTQLNSKNAELTRLQGIRDNQLPPKRIQRSQKGALFSSKQGELNTKTTRLTQLRKVRIGTPPSQPMHPFHTDPRGLTVASGLLGFAYTDSQPYLFDSALGRMAMYFKGLNKQFFSAYYDVNTARARWSLAAAAGSLTLVSRTSDSQVNETALVVAAGGDADHCAVTLGNTKTGLTETWTDVPREVNAFAQVLNGEVTEKIFAGKLNNNLSGTAITTIDLKDGLPREAPAGSTLIVEDSSSAPKQVVKLTISATASSGSKQISINSATPSINADAKVYLLLYDYAAKASSNRTGYTLDNGNLQVNVVVGQAAGKVSNATASRIADAQSPQWVADAPGSALYFDGTDDYLYGETANSFQHKGDISMEAWVRPLAFTGDTRLIHCNTPSSDYSLGLRKQALNSTLSFDGTGDYVTLPTASKVGMKNHDFTVEAWVKVNPSATGSDQPILGNTTSRTNYALHLIIRNDKPYLSFWDDDLADRTVLTKGTWYHLAFRYTAATKEQAVFVNGDLTSNRTASDHYKGIGILYIGRAYTSYMHGELDEVRIWNIARDANDIKADMPRRLGGQETGLVAYYHFENRNANDRSGNGHHGTLHGNLTSRNPVASPLSTYVCFASVGGGAIATTEPIVSNSWHHFAAVYNQSYALKFDGNDVGDAGNESMLNITEDLTIEAFVKLYSLGRKHGILCKGIMDNGGEGSVPYAFYIDESGKLVFAFEDEDGRNYSYSSSLSLTVNRNRFYHVAVVRKMGQEKLEKTGTKSVQYTDKDGATQTNTFNTIESIEFEDYGDIRFYFGKIESGYARHDAKHPLGNTSPLYIGRSYIAGQEQAQLLGTISEIRIWNVARSKFQVNSSDLLGTEGGLTGWWRFEENAGNIAYDAKGGNHARISGAQWVKNPDHKASSFVIYRDGQTEATASIITHNAADNNQFTLGAKESSSSYSEHYKGNLEELRIWKTARRKEEILDNLFTRLKGEKNDLIANYSFDDITSGEVKDSGLKSNHAKLPATSTQQPTEVLSTAPISNDTAQVRSALAGVKTRFHEQISGRPAVAEYADTQRLEDGSITGIYKRCYAYTNNGNWLLSTGYKVGNLTTEWIGQAQFDPQVTGFIEGAPPIPSENLTEGYFSTSRTFNRSSEVALNESESVNYSISTSKESGFSSGFELEADLGMKFDPRIILAPLGIGISKKLSFSMKNTHKLSMEANGSWSGGESYGSGQNVSRKMSAAITGNWDVPDKTKWANPDQTRRFIPANMGFAFVESETADIYALRLEHNGALVAFRMLPNPDIPKDTNILPFPINPRYTKQGTLDGRLGYKATGNAYDPDYLNSSGYGEYSYFKPKEAYQLKKRIEREEQKLKDFYSNFDTTPGGARMMAGLAGGFGSVAGGTAALGTAVAAKLGASVAGGPILSGAMIAAGMGSTIGSLIDAAATADEGLPEKYARRNIVNTYVWTADGGFYEESTQISQVRSDSSSGKYAFSGKTVGGFKLEVDSGVTSNFALNGMLGGSLNLTKSKSEDAKNSFSISMKLSVPDNLQKYVYKTANDTSSGVTPVFDNNNNPVIQPGKVDAYRFMSFYLEPRLDNFEDLFGKVVDPIWLEESQAPNAMAMRQANQASKKPKCWRLFHRVTFISRILPDFPDPTALPLQKKMKDLNIASNYELVRRLDPFVRDHTADLTQFKDAVKAAVQAYLPELAADKELNQITLFLADYYGVTY